MPVVQLPSGSTFVCPPGVSILEAASQAGLTLAYSCKTGRCSTCKCRVNSGVTTALHPESGLTDAEKAGGWVLSCVRSADTDLEIEVEDLGGVTLPSIKTLPCRISRMARLAPDVMQVELRLPPTASFEFIAGQYIDVIGPGGIRRSYSIANAPATAKTIELHIRAVKGGAMSDYWFHHARENDLLRLNGPLGTFFLRGVEGLNLVFLATGTGMAPVKAMLESLAQVGDGGPSPRSITVAWGGRQPEDLYLDLSALPLTFNYLPVLSRADGRWAGARGHVQQALLEEMPALDQAVVYACGSSLMIQSARDLLVKHGLPPSRFHSDAFVAS